MMNTTWSKTTKYLVGIGLAILGIFVLNLSGQVIPLLIMAALIAVIVRPVILWLQHRIHLPRGLAVGLVYLGLAILAPLVIVLTIPMVMNALDYVRNLDYQRLLQIGAEWLRSTLIAIKTVQLPVAGLNAYVERAIDTALEGFQPISLTAPVSPSLDAIAQPVSSALKSVMEAGTNLVGELISQSARITFIFLASAYISLDAHRFREAILEAAPAIYRPEFSGMLDRITRVWNAFFHGELILMLVIGVVTTIGLTALGMPGALYLGIIAGLLEMVPNLGPIISLIPAVIVALMQGSAYLPISHLAFAALIIVFYILVQQLENSLIVPRVLGRAVDLPPVIVMTGVVVGVSTGGILGALLATPVIATSREILQYIHRKMQDLEPIPTENPAPEPASPPSVNWLMLLLSGFEQQIRSRLPKSR